MTLAYIASATGCAVFAAAMVHALATDLLRRRIHNWLIAFLIAAYAPLAVAAGIPPGETGMALLAAILVFGACLGCFAAGWMGGGDAKLATACVLWLGADQALPFVLLTSVLGGALTFAMMLSGMLHRQPAGLPSSGQHRSPRTVPYGLALAGAGLILLRDSPWAAGL